MKKVFLLLSLTLVIAVVAQANRAGQFYAKMLALSDALNANESSYSSSDISRVNQALDDAIHAANTVGNGTGVMDCYNLAYSVLSDSQAKEVCANGGTKGTGECVKTAYKILNFSQTVEVCKERGTAETGECVTITYKILNSQESTNFCKSRGTTAKANCLLEAYKTMSKQDAIALCTNI